MVRENFTQLALFSAVDSTLLVVSGRVCNQGLCDLSVSLSCALDNPALALLDTIEI
jgi:hypothetical protein